VDEPVAAALPDRDEEAADAEMAGGGCSGGGGSEVVSADAVETKGLFRIERGPEGSLPFALDDGGEAEYAAACGCECGWGCG
jgi:hypothetical protein